MTYNVRWDVKPCSTQLKLQCVSIIVLNVRVNVTCMDLSYCVEAIFGGR